MPRILVLVALTASILPRPAEACTPLPEGLRGYLPVESPAQLPANGAVFVQYAGALPAVSMARRAPDEDNALIVESFGTDWAVARLQTDVVIGEGIESVSVLATQPENPDSQQFAFSLAIRLALDEQAPTPVDGVSWALEEVIEADPCGQAGYHLRASFLQASADDEGPIAGYALVETEGTEPETVRQFMPPSLVDGPVSFYDYVGQEASALEGRCFAVVGVDRAANLSSPLANRFCVGLEEDDAGTRDALSFDLGPSADAGSPGIDAGPTETDAARDRDGLGAAREEGCGCASSRKRNNGSGLLAVGLAVLALAIRRWREDRPSGF